MQINAFSFPLYSSKSINNLKQNLKIATSVTKYAYAFLETASAVLIEVINRI